MTPASPIGSTPISPSSTGPGEDIRRHPARMNERVDLPRGMRFLVIAATLVVIVSGIHQAQSVLAALLVAVFLAMLGTPPVLWLERKRIPTLVSVLLVVAAMVAILLAAGAIVGASVSSFSAELPA